MTCPCFMCDRMTHKNEKGASICNFNGCPYLYVLSFIWSTNRTWDISLDDTWKKMERKKTIKDYLKYDPWYSYRQRIDVWRIAYCIIIEQTKGTTMAQGTEDGSLFYYTYVVSLYISYMEHFMRIWANI